MLYAEVAWMYQELGRPTDARRLVETFDADNLSRLPRDHDYLLTLQLSLDVALAQGLTRLVEAITPLLLPYAGRAVVNAGAVMFHGVTDDPWRGPAPCSATTSGPARCAPTRSRSTTGWEPPGGPSGSRQPRHPPGRCPLAVAA